MTTPHPDTTPPPQGLAALRSATARQHEAIDKLLGLRDPFGLAHYARVLQGLGAFLAAWEPRMALRLRGEPCAAWFEEGRRLHLIERDLQSLGLPARNGADAFVPPLAGIPDALGSLYVLEGSALGGQFIAARARRSFGLTPLHGAAYFHGCGAGTGARWREFQAIAAARLDGDAQACGRAAGAAVQTFDGMTALFRDLLHEHAVA